MPPTSPRDAESPVAPERARRRGGGASFRWAVAVVITIVVHAGAFFFITIPESVPFTEKEGGPRVAWLGERATATSSTVGEQLSLFDQAPLFFPTEWNFASREMDLFGGGASPADTFGYYAEKLVVPAGRGPSGLHPPITTVENSREALGSFSWPTLSAFGRVDRPRVSVPPRLATIQVRDRIGGEPLFETDLPAGEDVDWPDWQPFEMLVLVGRTGVIGEPLIVPVGAGVASVEDYFREFVRTRLRLDLRVPPGHYRILVGP